MVEVMAQPSQSTDAYLEALSLALDRVAFARHLGIEPDEWQQELLSTPSNRTLLNIARQCGKSLMSAVIALHRALYHPRSLILILAPAERQAKETFGKVSEFTRQLGHNVPTDSNRKLGLQLSNGSRIEALPGSEKTIRGFSGASLLIIDEAARVDDDLYYAVRPMLAVSGGALMMLSTPFGKRGVFYEAWHSGQDWDRYEVPATEVPRISPMFLAEEAESMPPATYRQEYLCSFEETDQGIFPTELIDKMTSDEVEPLFADEEG